MESNHELPMLWGDLGLCTGNDHTSISIPNGVIKEEPTEEATSTQEILSTDPQSQTPFSNALKIIQTQATSAHIDDRTNGQILPYPTYNCVPGTSTNIGNETHDVYDMISKTAQNIVASLQNSTAVLEMGPSDPSDGIHVMGHGMSNLSTNNHYNPVSVQHNSVTAIPSGMMQNTHPLAMRPTDDGHASISNNPFHIDQSLFNSVPVHQQSEELQSLGLQVYNQEDLEKGIMDQVDQAMAKEEEARLIKMVEKDVKAVKDDMKLVKDEMISIITLEKALSQASLRSIEAAQKLQLVERQKENKVKQLMQLKARLQMLNKKLNPYQGPQTVGGEAQTGQGNSFTTTSSAMMRTVQYTDPHAMRSTAEGTTEGDRPSTSNNPFHIDQSLLNSVPVHQQSEELQSLGLQVYNQEDLEKGIMDQVDQAMAKDEEARLIKMLEKDVKAVKDDMKLIKDEVLSMVKMEKALSQASFKSKEAAQKLKSIGRQKENKIKQMKKLKARLKMLNKKLNPGQEPEADGGEAQNEEEVAIEQMLGLGPKRAETETERMIRQGEMTPFGTVMFKNQQPTSTKPSASQAGPRLTQTGEMTDFEKYLADQQQKKICKKRTNKPMSSKDKNEELKSKEKSNKTPNSGSPFKKSKSAPSLTYMKEDETKMKKSRSDLKKQNMFDARDKRVYKPAEKDFSNYRSSRPRFARLGHNFSGDGRLSDHEDLDDDSHFGNAGDQEYIPPPDMLLDDDDDYLSGDKEPREVKARRAKKRGKRRGGVEVDLSEEDEERTPRKKKKSGKSDVDQGEGLPNGRQRDDGDYESYCRRVKSWKRGRLRRKQEKAVNGEPDSDDSEFEDVEVDDGFKVPAKVWTKLYKYQKTCVKWLWELHMQQAGGIIGDEMGLGKTIQLISFLVGLRVSKARDKGANTKYLGLGPTLIACPATVMHQWVKEFHKWWPPFRVAVLHGSGSFNSSPAQLIDDIAACHGVIITSFSSLTIHQDLLLDYDWHYVVLDEGHKIRNPDAQVTIAAKRFRTCHRLILSGSPIQNNLKELWSLFDFIFPGKLGTLPDFMEHFAVPIQQGGYSTASQVQVQTAYKCACVLRDTINPYLLRRMKSDVRHNLSLPDKNEQVLFCRLTEHQRDIYKEYIESRECQQIVKGEFMVFPGLITLRKICNHPDLTTGGPQEFDTGRDFEDEEREFGHYKRSGKMIVVESLLKLWRRQGHRVLLFSQSKQMLDVLESFVNTQGYTYIRMDGGTSISARQPLINKFNGDPSYFAFLLTTRVGGLGVNLTGANRVVIFDPDWNPSTDTQARERAWRIGQTKDVTVYRLITAGTIEEKIYHRQIFKQFLTNRVLKDPKQRRLFKANDMYELFTLNDVDPRGTTETSAIFAGTGSDVKINKYKRGSADTSSTSTGAMPVKKPNRFDLIRAEKEKAKAVHALEIDSDEDFGLGIETPAVKPKKVSRTKADTKSRQKIAAAEPQGDGDTPEVFPGKESPELCEPNSLELSKSDTIDLTKDDSKESGTSNDSNAEVSNEDSRTKRLKELARKLSQKFSLKGELCFGKEKKLSTEKSGSKQEKKDEKKNKVEPGENSQKTTDKSKTNDSVDGRETSMKNQKKEKKSKEDKKESKHHKKSKKRRRKDAVFEGERITNLAKFEMYSNAEADPEKEKVKKADQDEYVLAKLFKKTGVHSAMQHDKIMMSSDPDFALVEGEAERVAREAVRALKHSRSQCHSARSGIPTWTGQSGGQAAKPRFGLKKNFKLMPSSSASKPNGAVKSECDPSLTKPDSASPGKQRHFDGTIAGNVKTISGKSASLMSSGELLSRMRARNQLATENATEASPDQNIPASQPADCLNIDLITDIRNYVAFMAHVDGQASTQELVDYFKSKIPTENSAKFKAMLKQVCEFHKRDGVGLWCLKPEFR